MYKEGQIITKEECHQIAEEIKDRLITILNKHGISGSAWGIKESYNFYELITDEALKLEGKRRPYQEENNPINLRLRWKLLTKYNFTCQYCGRKAPQVVLEIDHKLPKSKGGQNKEQNLIIACKECNIGKSNIILNKN